MKSKVKYTGSAPSNSPKAVEYADIKDQGRIPYGKTADAPMAGDTVKLCVEREPRSKVQNLTVVSF